MARTQGSGSETGPAPTDASAEWTGRPVMQLSSRQTPSRERTLRLDDAPPRVLIVDDDAAARRALARVLSSRGIVVLTADDGTSAMDVLAEAQVDVALVDLIMPTVGGLELLDHIRAQHSGVEAIIMTAFGDVETAVKAVQGGAYHFLTKPFRSNDEVVLTVKKAAERRRLLDRALLLERRLEQMERFGDLIGNSPRMQEVYRLALGVAPTSSTVLILGESGTGKELTARAVHQHSPRSQHPFVAVNCSAIPIDLVESELFGHVRGAFTGATNPRPGLFEAANSGSIFLDEVGDLPLLAQVKLLRVLQEGEVKRVGSNDTRQVDVRVLAATNVDLKTRIAEGTFREDLYYRLNVIAIALPPLRERREDIPLLAYHFLAKYSARAGREIRRIDPEALALLENQPWPGNVRELENAIEYAAVFCRDDTIVPSDLPATLTGSAEVRQRATGVAPSFARLADLPYREAKAQALEAFETQYFSALLERSGGNVSEAARQSGLDRSNFRRAAKRVGVGTDERDPKD